jgi:hypothetical protein
MSPTVEVVRGTGSQKTVVRSHLFARDQTEFEPITLSLRLDLFPISNEVYNFSRIDRSDCASNIIILAFSNVDSSLSLDLPEPDSMLEIKPLLLRRG